LRRINVVYGTKQTPTAVVKVSIKRRYFLVQSIAGPTFFEDIA
jgi:hypothetical protein